jgi:hypothetical protein
MTLLTLVTRRKEVIKPALGLMKSKSRVAIQNTMVVSMGKTQLIVKQTGQVFKVERIFSNKNFNNEINFLSKQSPKRKFLDVYDAVIQLIHWLNLGKKPAKRKKPG